MTVHYSVITVPEFTLLISFGCS